MNKKTLASIKKGLSQRATIYKGSFAKYVRWENYAYWWDTAKLWVKKTAQKVVLELTVWVFEFAVWIVNLFGKKEK